MPTLKIPIPQVARQRRPVGSFYTDESFAFPGHSGTPLGSFSNPLRSVLRGLRCMPCGSGPSLFRRGMGRMGQDDGGIDDLPPDWFQGQNTLALPDLGPSPGAIYTPADFGLDVNPFSGAISEDAGSPPSQAQVNAALEAEGYSPSQLATLQSGTPAGLIAALQAAGMTAAQIASYMKAQNVVPKTPSSFLQGSTNLPLLGQVSNESLVLVGGLVALVVISSGKKKR